MLPLFKTFATIFILIPLHAFCQLVQLSSSSCISDLLLLPCSSPLVTDFLAPLSSAGPAKVETASLMCCIATLISVVKSPRDSACKLLCQHFQEAISP